MDAMEHPETISTADDSCFRLCGKLYQADSGAANGCHQSYIPCYNVDRSDST